MPGYTITMKQTRTVTVRFNAKDDRAAKIMAEEIHRRAGEPTYASGDEDTDYELVRQDNDRTILPWRK